MGDPSYVPGQPQNAGTSQTKGLFPRSNQAACGSSIAITKSFCDTDDEFCANGNSLQVHLSYVQTYGTKASQFIASQVNGNATKI